MEVTCPDRAMGVCLNKEFVQASKLSVKEKPFLELRSFKKLNLKAKILGKSILKNCKLASCHFKLKAMKMG
jgi:hypothetical protein